MKFGSDKEWVYGRLKLKTGGGGFWVCGNHSICLFFFGISQKVLLQNTTFGWIQLFIDMEPINDKYGLQRVYENGRKY